MGREKTHVSMQVTPTRKEKIDVDGKNRTLFDAGMQTRLNHQRVLAYLERGLAQSADT